MRAKLLAGAAAIALAAGVMTTSTPASAAPWGWHHGYHGWGWGDGLAAGIIGGAVAAATSPLWAPGYYGYGPGPAYVYDYVPAAPVVVGGGGDVGWCEAHFRSYNPATGMYLGYDGVYHHCP